GLALVFHKGTQRSSKGHEARKISEGKFAVFFSIKYATMNIFYTPPSQIHNGFAEISGQEAKHASKVMRVREDDQLTVVDGEGGWYEGVVRQISKQSVQLEIKSEKKI